MFVRSLLVIVRLVVLAIVVALPWAFAGMDPTVRTLLGASLFLCTFSVFFITVLTRQTLAPFPWLTILPLSAGIALGVFQICDVGQSVCSQIAPRVSAWRSELVPATVESELPLLANTELAAQIPHWNEPVNTPSLIPALTRKMLGLLICGAMLFAVASQVFAARGAMMALAVGVTVNGVLLSLFGIVQQLTFNGKIYWVVTREQGGIPFGPFVCHNNAAGFLSMSLATSLLCLTSVWGTRNTMDLGAGRTGRDRAGLVQGHPHWNWRVMLSQLDWKLVASIAAPVCIIAGILCSQSRGAILGLLTAAVATFFFAIRGRGRWTIFGLSAAVFGLAVAFMLWCGQWEHLWSRMQLLMDDDKQESRIALWREVLTMTQDFAILGSGIGTFGFVQPAYQFRPMLHWHWQAENVYLEALVEGGAVGLGLLLLTLAGVWWSVRRHLKLDLQQGRMGMGLFGVFLLAGQMVCAFFDYGLRMPANMALMAVLAGAIVGSALLRGRTSASAAPTTPEPPGPLSSASGLLASETEVAGGARQVAWIPLALAFLLFSFVQLWGGRELGRSVVSDISAAEARLQFDEYGMTLEELDELIAEAQRAVASTPDDPRVQLRLAEFYLVRYRKQVLAQIQEEVGSSIPAPKIWEYTRLLVLKMRANQFARDGELDNLRSLREQAVTRSNLLPALEHLLEARHCGPTLPQVHLLLAQTAFLLSEPSADEMHLSRALALAPGHARTWHAAGLMHLTAGRTAPASEAFRRSLELDSSLVDEIAIVAATRLAFRDIVNRVLPAAPETMVRFGQRMEKSGAAPENLNFLADRVLRELSAADLPESKRQYLAGAAFALKRDYRKAAEHLAFAVGECPDELEWRLQLARVYRELKNYDGARKEARWCVWLHPDNAEYVALLQDIEQQLVRRGDESTSRLEFPANSLRTN